MRLAPAFAVAIAAASAGAQATPLDSTGAACGAMTPPYNGFVIGTVSDVARRPVADATVSLGWLEAKYAKDVGLRLQRYSAEARSDSLGRYAICGVAVNTTLNMFATRDSLSTGLLALPQRTVRVQRRDMVVAAAPESTTMRGVVSGTVRTRLGRPVPNARVVTAGVDEVRSNEDGRFVLRAPPGTRQVEVLSLGSLAAAVIVDVMPNDTSVVTLDLQRVTTLAPVTVTASAVRQRRIADIADRDRLGISKHIDSVVIRRYNQLIYAIEQMTPLDHICGGQVRIDGFLFDTTELRYRFPHDFAHVEVISGGLAPMEYKPVRAGSTTIANCAVVLLWTKLGMP
jgi:hypothetical protein